jgi:uncharacterized protein YfaP (DUF2135 family)
MENTMHKTLFATFAALTLMSGAASAAYAESNNLASVETPATAWAVTSGPAMNDVGSEAYPTFASTATQQSQTAARDTGSEHYQDFAGTRSDFGSTLIARRNGNNARG